MRETILHKCEVKGLRMTGQRRVIVQVLETAHQDHPDVEALYAKVTEIDPSISIATVYRTVKLLEEAGILIRNEFADGRARYETADREHHDHLIDLSTGKVIEFCEPEIEALQEKLVAKLGYKIRFHRLEIYADPINSDETD